MAHEFTAHGTPQLLTSHEADELHAFGVQLAGKGIDVARQEDLDAIDMHSKAFAAAAETLPFDHAAHPHDQIRHDQFKQHQKDLYERAVPAAEFADARVRELEHDLAHKAKGLVKPTVPTWIVPTAISVLALTIAPTLHDQFFTTLADEFLAWAISGSMASIVGAFVCWTLLGTYAIGTHRTALNWLGILSGIGIGIGMGILRVAYATTSGEYIFMSALTVVEISAVLALEFVAKGLRSEHADWLAEETELVPIRADLEAARANQSRCHSVRADLEHKCAEHLAYVEFRQLRHHKQNELHSHAKAVAERGYREQLADNWRIRTGNHHPNLRRVA